MTPPPDLLTPPAPPTPTPLALPPLTKSRRRTGRSRKGVAVGRWLPRLALAAAVAAAGWAVWKYALPYFIGSRSADRPLTADVTRGELKVTVTDRGELESIDAVQVNCELQGGGKLVSILDEGKRVKKGDEVAKLDTDALVNLLNQQDAKWQTAEGRVTAARNDLTQARYKAETEIAKTKLAMELAEIDLEAYKDPEGEYKKELDDKKGKLELANKELKEAEDDLAFTRGMVKDGYAPLEQLRPKEFLVQQKQFQVTSAKADIVLLEKFTRKKKITEFEAKAKDAVRELERTKESQKAAIAKAEGELKAAESTAAIEKKHLERLQEQIDRCTIKAPSEGIVVYSNSRYWDESSRIRPGAQLYYRQEIFSLPDLSRMRVKLKIHESVIKKVKVGMPATMQMEALPNRVLHGKVLKIGTIAQAEGWRGAGVKQYETEVSIDDLPLDAGLKPGMTAEVKILVNTVPDALTVPVAAVAEYEGKRVVYVVTPKGVDRREVAVGESNEQYIQIVDGAAAGEDVALDARTRAAADLKASKPDDEKDKPDEKPAKPADKPSGPPSGKTPVAGG